MGYKLSYLFKRSFLMLIIGLLVGVTISVACGSSDDSTGWTSGRFLWLYIPGAEKTDQVKYNYEEENRVIKPKEAGNTLVAVNITVLNNKSSRVLLSMSEESVLISDMSGDRYPIIDPFERAEPTTEISSSDENVYSPFLWGDVELLKEFQIQGWLIFEVPFNFVPGVIVWEETESIRASIVQ